MPDPTLLHQLTQVGLDAPVATAYLKSLEEGAAALTDAEVELLLGEGLAERGQDGDGPVVHPPEGLLARRAHQLEVRARLMRELSPPLEALHRVTGGRPEPSVQSIRSPEGLRSTFYELQTSAREQLRAMDRGPYVATRGASPGPEQLQAMRAGVVYEVIYAAEVIEDEETREEVYEAVRLGEVARLLPSVPMKMVLADDDAALVVRVMTGGHVEGFLVQPSLLLDTLHGFFDALWQLAMTIVPTRATDDPTEQERMVLRGMANGLTDEAIARELGISERTVARRISRMQDVLATRSRFQLGLQAARRGLL